jgi:hypothetical protein
MVNTADSGAFALQLASEGDSAAEVLLVNWGGAIGRASLFCTCKRFFCLSSIPTGVAEQKAPSYLDCAMRAASRAILIRVLHDSGESRNGKSLMSFF